MLIFEDRNNGQVNHIISSVDNTKLPCYTLPPTQHHGFFRNLLPYPLNLIFYLLLLLFKKQFDFFAICDQTHDVTCDATHDATHDPPHVPILDPIHDLMQSDPVQSWFCQHCCGFHILVNPQPQLFLYVHVSYNCC